jgi:hypothetical protein
VAGKRPERLRGITGVSDGKTTLAATRSSVKMLVLLILTDRPCAQLMGNPRIDGL